MGAMFNVKGGQQKTYVWQVAEMEENKGLRQISTH